MNPENPTDKSDRRFAVPFDPDHFAHLAEGGEPLPAEDAFRHAYETNLWAGASSRSGPGSDHEQTRVLRVALPALFKRLAVRTLLDLPCGDFHWMSTVPLEGIDYIGADLLPEIVMRNQAAYSRPGIRFEVLDLMTSSLPAADLLLCRDCLVHLAFSDIGRVLENIRRSGIPHVLFTTFPGQDRNTEVRTGDWRPLNLEAPPFSFPPPIELIEEGCTEGAGRFRDKSLGLWRVADLRV